MHTPHGRPLEELTTHLKSISRFDWEKLFQTLPQLQELQTDEAWTSESERRMQWVHHLIYDLDLVPVFHWQNWADGRYRLEDVHFDYGGLPATELCKMLTYISRADRFAEGTLERAVRNGTMLRILKALENRVKEGKLDE